MSFSSSDRALTIVSTAECEVGGGMSVCAAFPFAKISEIKSSKEGY
jgi:hypothetical protein